MKLCRPANISEDNFNGCEFHIQLFCYPSKCLSGEKIYIPLLPVTWVGWSTKRFIFIF